ncbi:alkyl hydroperoxide reductase [Paraburkholderia ginsengiterrae]|uniref:thioredoxin-dependent peroxiredoxin n=1 Tax=Paraburkholderia ginsengiterrae TaxID=1462993 RepID=A0A1A9N8K4_9BURK|nr:peroxiredoxin-like family protein [Paraburkholderia ginsengiterrae]OAJ55110.1 alkyl hydroperoxide reductase [Paraburkholderia ginsengiterrae]OAJ61195.1 alkyl hydroperoxide reductase [Paraburkholderia ginsengiterrae]
MSLQDKLDAFKADFKGGKAPFFAPPEIHPIMERATTELIASGQATRALAAGDIIPNFILQDQDGNEVSSAALLEKGPLIVTFYRGVWCPYCNLELQALNEALPELQRYGASVVAISPQSAVNSRKSVRVNGLNFPVLNDTRNETAAAFGLRFALPDYLVELYKNLKNDLPAFNGDPSWTLPMPARYVIGMDGVVAYSEVNPDYTHRPDPSEMIPVLQKLTQPA